MKKLLPILILVFALSAFAQKPASKPAPAEAAKIALLQKLKKDKAEAETALAALLVKYSDDYPQVGQTRAQIAKLDEEIAALMKDPALPMTMETLPDDPALLLKIIIIQNQKIIELLEKKKP